MSNDLCFVMVSKSYALLVWIYTIEYIVIFSDCTCLVEFRIWCVILISTKVNRFWISIQFPETVFGFPGGHSLPSGHNGHNGHNWAWGCHGKTHTRISLLPIMPIRLLCSLRKLCPPGKPNTVSGDRIDIQNLLTLLEINITASYGKTSFLETNKTHQIKFRDTKVLIVFSESAEVVVLGENKSANSIELIWKSLLRR